MVVTFLYACYIYRNSKCIEIYHEKYSSITIYTTSITIRIDPLTEGGNTAQEVGRGSLLITVGEFSSAHSVSV